jgi:DNA-binding NtrC family response regulator
MKSTRVLILDDESTLRTALFRTFDRKGYSVVTSQSIEEAKSYCSVDKGSDKNFDLAIVDVNLPDGDGLEFMTYLKSIYPGIQVIVLTGFATIESAVLATQKGAYHFLTKPKN